MNGIYSPTTICAVATPPGIGGVAIIRISGQDASPIVAKLFKPLRSNKLLIDYQYRQAVYGRIIYKGELIDEVVAIHYNAPHSYTGEDVVEINCHGSVYICQRILSILLDEGCHMAKAGEFTQRAYLNGKMNLSEAEAVADIIHAETESQHRMAMTQLRGGYTQELHILSENLLKLTALMELELDFSEEDVEFANREQLLQLIQQLRQKLQKLRESFRLGNAIKRGIPVAIVGPTNAGKSTLLNALLGEERAIVSDIHGTTRDSIEETLNLGGYLFRFIDTAGIRQTSDQIEAIGIERSIQKMQEATICLYILDASRLAETQYIEQALEHISLTPANGRILILLNKVDLSDEATIDHHWTSISQKLPEGRQIAILKLSAYSRDVEPLKQSLIDIAELPEQQAGDVVVSNSRHQHLFGLSAEALERVYRGLEDGLPTDLLTPDLRVAIQYIGEITGKAITSDKVLHHIFQHFCIGK